MNQSPFPQQEQNPNEDLFGGQYNFGQNANPFGLPPVEPAKPSRRGRTCLLLFGAVFACVAVCCLCMVGMAYQAKEAVPPTFWVSLAQQDGLEIAESYNLVCPNSQALEFTKAFDTQYGSAVTITVETTSMSDDKKTVQLEGTLSYNGNDEAYDATFVMSSDEKFFVLFDCISEIHQVSPPLPAN